MALASKRSVGRGLEIIRIKDKQIFKLDTTGLHISESSLWFDPGKSYYICGNGTYKKKNLNEGKWIKEIDLPPYYRDNVRGNAWNDIFIAGSFSLLLHFNGSTWREYSGKEIPFGGGLWSSLSVKENVVSAVGLQSNGNAILLIGNRNSIK